MSAAVMNDLAPWVATVPKQWQVRRLGSVADVMFSNVDKHTFDGEVPIQLCNYTDVYKNDRITSSIEFMQASALPREIEKFQVRKGDVLATKDSETPHDIAISALIAEDLPNVLCGYHLALIRPKATHIVSEYLALVQTSKGILAQFEALAVGVTRFALSHAAFKEALVPVPPLSEQYQIAEYLDKAMKRLDKLMALRQRQIELLQEQRTALIQQAVTRGLNPNALLKDSGLTWLGLVPKHWEVKKLKYLARFKSGETITSDKIDEIDEYAVFGGNGFRGYTKSYTHEGEYVLIGRQGALCGNINYAKGKFWASEHAIVATLAVGNELVWFGEILRTMNLNQYSLSAAQPGIAVERIQNLFAPVPPASEQTEIVNFIQKENAKADRLLAAFGNQLRLLREYRAALIHECVTGQRPVTLEASIQPKQSGANVHFRRAVLGAEIIHRLHSDARFGRVKLEKIIYLSEAFAGIDLEGHYQRAAAGPFDNRALRSIETQVQKQKWYKPVKNDQATRYLPMEKAGGHQSYFERYWPEQRSRFERIIELLQPLKTQNCEMIATLFAVWNDRLEAKQSFTDDALVDEVLTNWHPSKQKITRDRWLKGLQWMRDKKLVPGRQPTAIQQ